MIEGIDKSKRMLGILGFQYLFHMTYTPANQDRVLAWLEANARGKFSTYKHRWSFDREGHTLLRHQKIMIYNKGVAMMFKLIWHRI